MFDLLILAAVLLAFAGSAVSTIMLGMLRMRLRDERQSLGIILLDTVLVSLLWSLYAAGLTLVRQFHGPVWGLPYWRAVLVWSFVIHVWVLVVRLIWWQFHERDSE